MKSKKFKCKLCNFRAHSGGSIKAHRKTAHPNHDSVPESSTTPSTALRHSLKSVLDKLQENFNSNLSINDDMAMLRQLCKIRIMMSTQEARLKAAIERIGNK